MNSSCLVYCTSNDNDNNITQYCRYRYPSAPLARDPKSIIEAEKAMTKELYDMSMEERENALHDVHGVNEYNIIETNEFVQRNLNALEIELQSSSSPNKYQKCESYQIAMKLNPNYVRGLYLMFLRCELFDVRLAAERMMRHFDLKCDIWGSNKLGRDITLEDFTEADRECIESGCLQILPQRDRAGRVIFVKIWSERHYRERINIWRSLWYLEMTILQDELTQKKGKVSVLYNVTENWRKTFDPILLKGIGKLKQATPVRTVATHYCFLDPAFGAIIKFISTVMDRKQRTRSKLHQGTHIEVQYDLMSYGIGTANTAIPVCSDGTLRIKNHLKWTKSRYQHEQHQRRQQQSMILQQHPAAYNNNNRCTKSTTVLIPYHTDVLFGNGKMLQMHLGNMKLNHILEEEGTRYFNATRGDKAGIALEIVLRMKQEFGTRFLKQQSEKDNIGGGGIDGLWMEVDDKIAVSKVCQGFRNRKSRPSTTTTSSSSTSTVPSSRSYSEGGQNNYKRKQQR